MTRIETEVYKQEADGLIGLRVITYDDEERAINNIVIVEPEDLIRLQTGLIEHNHDEIYVSLDTVNDKIRTIAQDFFNDNSTYRPPQFYLEDNGDLYIEYYQGELMNLYGLEVTQNERGGTIFLQARLLYSGEPYPNKTLKLSKNDVLINTGTTDENGICVFTVTNLTDATYTINYENEIYKDIEINGYGYKEYHAIFDENSNIIIGENNGTYNIDDGILTLNGSNKTKIEVWLSDYIINNNELWEINFKLKENANNELYISELNDNKKFTIVFTQTSMLIKYNGNTKYTISLNTNAVLNDWIPITVKKTSPSILIVAINEEIYTFENEYVGMLSDLIVGGYGYWSTLSITDLIIKTQRINREYTKTIYAPILDGTEQITNFENCIINTDEHYFAGKNGFLTEGFDNNEHWKLTCKVYQNGSYSQNCGFGLYAQQSTGKTNNCAYIQGGEFFSYSNITGYNFVTNRENIQTTQTAWMDCSIERINSQYLQVTLGNDDRIKIYWKDLPLYEKLCVGIECKIPNTTMQIKNIEVKTLE